MPTISSVTDALRDMPEPRSLSSKSGFFGETAMAAGRPSSDSTAPLLPKEINPPEQVEHSRSLSDSSMDSMPQFSNIVARTGNVQKAISNRRSCWRTAESS